MDANAREAGNLACTPRAALAHRNPRRQDCLRYSAMHQKYMRRLNIRIEFDVIAATAPCVGRAAQ